MNNSAFNYTLDYSKENLKERFTVDFIKSSRIPLSWKEECILTARHIRASTDKPIMIAMSGGIDAEVVGLSFVRACIDFEVMSVRHINGTNEHDIQYARRFCERYNIKHHIVEIDIISLMNSDYQRYVDMGYRAWDIFRFFQLFVLDTIQSMGYTAVLGGGEQIYINYNNTVSLQYTSSSVNVFEWSRINDSIHFPYFFQTTSEIMLAYMNHPYILPLLSKPDIFPNEFKNYSEDKIKVYHREWLDLEKRPKFTGYENIPLEPRIEIINRMYQKFGRYSAHIIPVSAIKQSLSY